MDTFNTWLEANHPETINEFLGFGGMTMNKAIKALIANGGNITPNLAQWDKDNAQNPAWVRAKQAITRNQQANQKPAQVATPAVARQQQSMPTPQRSYQGIVGNNGQEMGNWIG